MKKSDFAVEIIKVGNGFIIKQSDGAINVVEEDETNELSAGENLLWEIIDFFGLRGDGFARECLLVAREVGDEYTPQKGEKIVRKYYLQIVKKKKKAARLCPKT